MQVLVPWPESPNMEMVVVTWDAAKSRYHLFAGVLPILGASPEVFELDNSFDVTLADDTKGEAETKNMQ